MSFWASRPLVSFRNETAFSVVNKEVFMSAKVLLCAASVFIFMAVVVLILGFTRVDSAAVHGVEVVFFMFLARVTAFFGLLARKV
jgi:hypothetical protein